MKSLIYVGIFSLAVLNARPAWTDDIIVSLPMSEQTSEKVFHRFLGFLENLREQARLRGETTLPDPFNLEIPGPLTIQQTAGEVLPQDESTQGLLGITRRLLGLDLVSGGVNLSISRFSYSIGAVRLGIQEINHATPDSSPLIDGTFTVHQLMTQVGEIKLGLQIPIAGRAQPLRLEARIADIKVKTASPHSIKVKLLLNQNDTTKVNLEIIQASFAPLYQGLNPDDFEVSLGEITVPEMSLQVGGRRIQLRREVAVNQIRQAQDMIKKMLLEQLTNYLKKLDGRGESHNVFSVLKSLPIEREHWFPLENRENIVHTAMQLKFLKLFGVNRKDKSSIAHFELGGDFCTGKAWIEQEKLCRKSLSTVPSSVSRAQRVESEKKIRQKLSSSDNMISVSVSQNYINKLLTMTAEAGIWEESLSPSRLSFGEKKAFVRFDEIPTRASFPQTSEQEINRAGVLYLDLVYKGTGFQRFITGVRRIRFPVRLLVKLHIENRTLTQQNKHFTEVPHIIITAAGADCLQENARRNQGPVCVIDEAELGRHNPHGLSSNVRRAWFSGLIMNEIRDSISKIVGKEVMALPVKELRNLGLEEAQFESDQHGRMTGAIELKH